MKWPWQKQVDEAEDIAQHLHELHLHVDDMRAAGEIAEAARIVAHAVKELRSHVGSEGR